MFVVYIPKIPAIEEHAYTRILVLVIKDIRKYSGLQE